MHPHAADICCGLTQKSFEDETYYYMVMDVCPRGDVCQYLKAKQRLTEDEVREIARQVGGATTLEWIQNP